MNKLPVFFALVLKPISQSPPVYESHLHFYTLPLILDERLTAVFLVSRGPEQIWTDPCDLNRRYTRVYWFWREAARRERAPDCPTQQVKQHGLSLLYREKSGARAHCNRHPDGSLTLRPAGKLRRTRTAAAHARGDTCPAKQGHSLRGGTHAMNAQALAPDTQAAAPLVHQSGDKSWGSPPPQGS